ncbi:hypothetical protein DFH06DRAFT_1467320 [Mycena polygramma]|nr:hypothetical protein DFH06DRAFT_1467320 [Mycena polygramma]
MTPQLPHFSTLSLCRPRPVHTLPAELVSLIIDCLFPPPTPIVFPNRPLTGKDIIWFSQVCGCWREIAHSHPKYWMTYTLDLGSVDRTPGAALYFLETLQNFIARAASMPLAFTIIHGDYVHGRSIFVAILSAYSLRLHSLDLDIPQETANELCTSSSPPFDELTRLSISVRTHDDRDVVWADLHNASDNILGVSPLLAHLTIGQRDWLPKYPPNLDVDAWAPPFAQLTSFRAPNVWMATRHVQQLFTECVQVGSTSIGIVPALTNIQLVVCDIRMDECDPRIHDPLNSSAIVLPNLQSFTVHFSELYAGFWNQITTPALRTLSITSMYDEAFDNWPHDEFMAFKRRSRFVLEDLSLRFDFSAATDGIIELLHGSQELERLVLRWTGCMSLPREEIFGLLTKLGADPGRGGPPWLPNLRILALDATEESVEMLRARCAVQSRFVDVETPRLRDVTLYWNDEEDKEAGVLATASFRQVVEWLRATGCRVFVESMDFYGGLQYRDLDDEDF